MAFPRQHSEQSWFTQSLTLGCPSQKGPLVWNIGTLKWHPLDSEGEAGGQGTASQKVSTRRLQVVPGPSSCTVISSH